MAKKEEPIKNVRVTRELLDTSFDNEEMKVTDLIKKGFSHQQATSWLRKIHIDNLFNKLGG